MKPPGGSRTCFDWWCRAVPRLTSSATYKEGRLMAAWVRLARKLIIHLGVVRHTHKKSSDCKAAPTAQPIIGSTSDWFSFLSALYLCSHQPRWQDICSLETWLLFWSFDCESKVALTMVSNVGTIFQAVEEAGQKLSRCLGLRGKNSTLVMLMALALLFC